MRHPQKILRMIRRLKFAQKVFFIRKTYIFNWTTLQILVCLKFLQIHRPLFVRTVIDKQIFTSCRLMGVRYMSKSDGCWIIINPFLYGWVWKVRMRGVVFNLFFNTTSGCVARLCVRDSDLSVFDGPILLSASDSWLSSIRSALIRAHTLKSRLFICPNTVPDFL